MTDTDAVDAVRRQLKLADAFESTDDGFVGMTTEFDAELTVSAGEDAAAIEVVVEVPTLDAVVEGETVGEAVESGWYETLVRRLTDMPTVAISDVSEPEISRHVETVRIETAFETLDPNRAVEDANALIGYVEGTWLEGVVPGYEYGEPATTLLGRAQRTADDADPDEEASRRGGTPL